MPGRSQQKNRKLKCVAPSFSKLRQIYSINRDLMINLPLLKCTLHVLDFHWFDILNVKSIQNESSFTCVIILRCWHFALGYPFICCSNIAMFPEN